MRIKAIFYINNKFFSESFDKIFYILIIVIYINRVRVLYNRYNNIV